MGYQRTSTEADLRADGEAETCSVCSRAVSGEGSDRLRSIDTTGTIGAPHASKACDACRKSWARREINIGWREWAANRREREGARLAAPEPIGARTSITQRFVTKFKRSGPDECWEWFGARSGRGYGRIHIYDRRGRKKYEGAHRVAWELANGRRVPQGLLVMHSCDNPPCVNPAHLSVGTQLENMRDAARKGRLQRGGPSPAVATQDSARNQRTTKSA